MLHFEHCFFTKFLGTNSSIVFDDKENCHQEDKEKKLLWILIFPNRTVLIQIMIILDSNRMIVTFLCLVLRSGQTVMFATYP
jgi:hypothetical protein